MKKKRRGRRKRRGKKEKEEKRKKREKEKEETENEELTEEEHGDDKLKSSKANELGKLGWNWNNRNGEECEEKRRRRKLKNKRRRDRWIGNVRKKRREMKSSIKRKGGKCQGILRIPSQWCNLDMKKKKKWKRKTKRIGKGRKRRKRGRNSGKGRATYHKLKWRQAYEWGKLNWNNQTEEEFYSWLYQLVYLRLVL